MSDAPALDKARIEELVAKQVAQAYLDAIGPERLARQAESLADAIGGRTAFHLAQRFHDDAGRDARRTFAERIVDAAADQLVKTQKQAAREAERLRMLKAIRSPNVPHVMEELRGLVELEKNGKVRNARVPLLIQAFQEFGSYGAALRAVEDIDRAVPVVAAS